MQVLIPVGFEQRRLTEEEAAMDVDLALTNAATASTFRVLDSPSRAGYYLLHSVSKRFGRYAKCREGLAKGRRTVVSWGKETEGEADHENTQ